MKRTATACLVLSVLVTAATANAQVTARQGAAPPPEEEHFASPMILDLPLPDVSKIRPTSSLRLPEVYRYIVDGHVLLRGLTVGKRYRGGRKDRALELLITGQVFVADSYDRRLDIALRLLSGDAQIATQTLRNLKAEEERATPFHIVVPVDEQRLLSAYSANKPPTLQLTVTVRDDS